MKNIEKEEFEKFILHGLDDKISFQKCMENEILILLFSLPLIVWERNHFVFLPLCILPALVYLVCVINLKKGKMIEGVTYILHNGIMTGCFTFLFALSGIKILLYLFSGADRMILLFISSAGYIFTTLLIVYMAKRSMQKDKVFSIAPIPITLSGAFGIGMARIFLQDINDKTLLKVICIICFFLSYLTLIGVFNIFKYLYIKRHPEILKNIL